MARQRVALVGAELLRLDDQRVGGKRLRRRQLGTREKAPPRDDSRALRRGQAEGASSASTAVESSVCPVASRTVAFPSGSIGSMAIPWRRSATTCVDPADSLVQPLARLERVDAATARTAAAPGRAGEPRPSTSRSGRARRSVSFVDEPEPGRLRSATEPSVAKTSERPSSACSIACASRMRPARQSASSVRAARPSASLRLRPTTAAGRRAQRERREENSQRHYVPGLSSAPSASSVAAASADG